MKRLVIIILAGILAISLLAGTSFAGSNKTWSNIGKGLAIYEGVKVLTGRQGNIVDDVTGGMKPRQSSSDAGSYQDGYNAGYKAGYDSGYNTGFRQGVETSSPKN